ncbi:MAG: hypothetical protein JEZ00_21660 [Anaerolineaceae bacterium]|nr:hypothetical protein [Anaerolineaceae bacterium]
MQKLRGFSLPGWMIAIVILFVGILTFGFLIPDLGLYWDDWSKTLVNVLYGFEGYETYYAFDRPLSGWTHILFVSLIGNNKFLWQILNLSLRILAATGMWWGLKALWPNNKREVSLAAVLYFVMPIFTQQAAAVTFHQQWLQAGLYFLGLGLIIRSLDSPKWYWLFTFLAMAATVAQLTVTEYFLGLVLIIPIFIWLALRQKGYSAKVFWKKTLHYTTPYLLLITLYSLWRFVWMSLPVEDPYALSTLTLLIQQPWNTLISLANTIFLDLLEILLGSWAPVFDLSLKTASSPLTLFSWALSFVITVMLIIFFFSSKEDPQEKQPQHWVRQSLLIGSIILIAGLLPAWAIGKNLLVDIHANRYALPAMPGAALILVAAFSWFIQNWQRKVVVLSILIGLAAGFHIREVNEYRWDWKEQTDFYWQLYWRAPKIQEKTAIFFEEDPFPNQGLFSTSSAVNLLYVNNRISADLPYWVYSILPRYAASETFPENQDIQSSFRSLHFEGNTDDMILVHYNPSHGKCWWILSGDDQLNPYLSPQERQWAADSNLDLIENHADVPLPNPELFGPEPRHDWCYFYEKAELAVQDEAWQEVADLGDEIQDMGYAPEQNASSNSPREWLPFILGYGMTEELDLAFELTLKNLALDPKYQPMLCAAWNKILPMPTDNLWREKINNALNCSATWESIIINLEP